MALGKILSIDVWKLNEGYEVVWTSKQFRRRFLPLFVEVHAIACESQKTVRKKLIEAFEKVVEEMQRKGE